MTTDSNHPTATPPHTPPSIFTATRNSPTRSFPPLNQIIILTLNHNTRTFHSPFSPNSSINDLITTFFSPHHPPKNIRTTIHNRPIPSETKLTHLQSTVTSINILLPIIGGSKDPCAPATSTTNSTPPANAYKGPKLSKPLKRNGYTLRIATINCNGCLRNNPHDRHQLLWNFVHTNKIDVLFLIDHRTTPHSLQLIKNHGSKFLNLDIRLITTDITLLHKPSQHSAPAYNFHATVGGCAILTFGSLAHVTFPTSFHDPSGAGTFIGAKIQPHSSLPPVFLNAIYLFPPSQGPTTLNSRINTYLKSNNHNMTPCKWQRTIIAQLLKEQYDSSLNCAQIVGGDFNHRDWSNLNHPTTRTFISDLQLNNAAYDAVNAAKGDIPSPITFPQNGSWIDHFLHIGRVDILDFCDYKNDLVTTYSDHAPYSNDFYIHLPTTHYNIPRNLNLQAQSCLRATHLKKHDTLSIARYQALCNKHYPTLHPPSHIITPLQHETYYDQLCSSLIKLAKRATKITITTFKHTLPRWSPDLAFLYKFIKLLLKLKTQLLPQIPHVPQPLLTQTNVKITKFLHDNYSLTKVIDSKQIPRFSVIITTIFPTFPTIHLTSASTQEQLLTFINTNINKCKKLCHAKHQHEMRTKINNRVKINEQARAEGKMKQVISWILEKSPSPRFSTVVSADNTVHTLPTTAHKATVTHFTNHFSCHPWIHTSNINEQSEKGFLLRSSLLRGSWRSDFPTLTHSLDPRYQRHAAKYLDNFRIKATPSQQNSLNAITTSPITFEAFHKSILHKNGSKAPGPSGLTLSILQATPIEILRHLHSALHAMWLAKHVPKSWQSRELALLPKKPSSITLAEMRPLMLLEVLRKEWLSLVLKPIAIYLHQQTLLTPYQTGGIPNSGTEDAILQIVNALEDSTERAENIEILAFDKAKAFDSPARLSGISLAWQRMGVPATIADYIAECDNHNQIFPRTPYYLTHKTSNRHLAFHAAMGTPQGCSSASLSYLVVEDIILSTFSSHLQQIDPYLASDPTGILFPQPPTQFVDDTYVFCRSPLGAQTAIDLLQTAEPLLNIRINPSKTRHFSLHWSPPTTNRTPYYSLDPPVTTLHAFDSEGTAIPIPPIPLNSPTRVLGAFIAPDLSNDHITTLKAQINRIKATISRKKASLNTIWAVLKTSIYPKFTYQLKFTNLSMKDLSNLSAPFRDLIRRKANASHLPNAILFSGNSTPYSLPYHDLMLHTLKEEESTMLRMLGGTPMSRQIMHSLLSRGHRLITEHTTFSNSPIPCPPLPHPKSPPHSSHYCWALSLIQYLQAAHSNLHLTPRFPQSPTPKTITQTPLHSLHNAYLDSPLSVQDILDFESSYHIHFLEELFSYPPKSSQDTISILLPLFPKTFHKFIQRVITDTLATPTQLTLGCIIAREHILLLLPQNTQPLYVEGLIAPSSTPSPSQAFTRQWKHTIHNHHRMPCLLHLPHTSHSHPSVEPFPLYPITTQRYLRSAIGYTDTHAFCNASPLTQLILPRLATSLATTYAQPSFSCNFPADILSACKHISHFQGITPSAYTDGSMKPAPPLPSLTRLHPPSDLYTSIIIPHTPPSLSPWQSREVTALRIRFPPTSTATNYTAEILGVAVATALPLNSTTIYTDAKGIVTSTTKTIQHHLTTHPFSTPHLPRNYTDTGLLYKHIILNHNKIELHHIKAHQEDSSKALSTEHGTGNRIADLVAQGDIDIAQSLCRSLHVIHCDLPQLIQPQVHPPLISIGDSASQHDYYLHHPNSTASAYHTSRLNDWLQHTRPITTSRSSLQWEDLTWNLAGSCITKISTNPSTKIFLLKVLYDALPNAYTKHKYSLSRTTSSTQPSPILDPLCPLCCVENDSLSHLLCSCTHTPLAPFRRQLTRSLLHLQHNSHLNSPDYFPQHNIISTLIANFDSPSPDHRNLLGLFHIPSLCIELPQYRSLTKFFYKVVAITAPYISAVWKLYNDLTHSPSTHPTPHSPPTCQSSPFTPAPSRLLIISGNNGALSLQTVQDHPPAKYHSTRRRKRTPHSDPSHLSQTKISTLFNPTPPTLSQSQTLLHTTLTSNPSSSSPHLPAPNPSPTSRSQNSTFSFPKHPAKLPPSPPPKPTNTPTPSTPNPTHNQFSPLEIIDIPTPADYNLTHHKIKTLTSHSSSDTYQIFNELSLTPHDVPRTGDCFYLTIELFIAQHYPPTILLSVTYLRTVIADLLTSSQAGSHILQTYNQTHDVIHNILPNLKHSHFPNRDIFSQDYEIAAMATFLNTTIEVFTLYDTTLIKHIFTPYPNHNSTSPLPHNPPPIQLWYASKHYQLLLPFTLALPSLTQNLLPLPPNPKTYNPISIPAPTNLILTDDCQYSPHQHLNAQRTFCPTTCHPLCQNHYSAFRTAPHLRLPQNYASSQILATAGIDEQTPIVEINAPTLPHPTPSSFPITPTTHSTALSSHPLLKLMYSTTTPNCHLETILVPEPAPHLKLFLVASTNILPYTPLRIRPPPEPPPPTPQPQSQVEPRSITTRSSLITSYFSRIPN